MKRTLITTEDGSHSLFVQELNEHYHSTHGAIQESRHVFIEAGLKYVVQQNPLKPVHILEIGFGTGLNALLTLVEAEKLNVNVHYTALEAFPVEPALVAQLNYANQLNENTDTATQLFHQLHEAPWEQDVQISAHFTLHKIKNTLQDVALTDSVFNLIYFDAFGPPVQPEMWTEAIFQKIADAMEKGGILVTYCAKGEVKRNMKKAGFGIERLQGPPGKREMTRGSLV